MSLAWFFSSHLTSYEKVELWITRSSLLISFCIIGPTVILIFLDLLLWCFRAGQGPSADLIRRSKSGIDLLSRKSRSNSWSSGASGILGMSPVDKTADKTVDTDAASAAAAATTAATELHEKVPVIHREETHPQGGVSNDDTSPNSSLRQTEALPVSRRQAASTRGDLSEGQDSIGAAALESRETEKTWSRDVEPPRGDLLHTLNLGKVIE